MPLDNWSSLLATCLGSAIVVTLLRRHRRRRPHTTQPHELRFDDTELRTRLAETRATTRPVGTIEHHWRTTTAELPAPDPPQRERPPER